MSEFSRTFGAKPIELVDPTRVSDTVEDHLTPAGLQDVRDIATRRVIFTLLNLATMAVLLWGISSALGAGGWSASDIIILGCFLFGAPWTVMGLWNAFLGIWLLHGRKDGLNAVAPHLSAMEGEGALKTRTSTVDDRTQRRS